PTGLRRSYPPGSRTAPSVPPPKSRLSSASQKHVDRITSALPNQSLAFPFDDVRPLSVIGVVFVLAALHDVTNRIKCSHRDGRLIPGQSLPGPSARNLGEVAGQACPSRGCIPM